MKIADWIQTARTGDELIYFLGDLASRREKSPTIDNNASLAYRLYEDGQITLTQRRVKDFAFEYIAIKI